jgi:hypothetical protein
MAHLGDVLELLFARTDPTGPVHAVIEERYDAAAATRAGDTLSAEMSHELSGTMPAAVKAMVAPAMATAVAFTAWSGVSQRLRRAPKPPPRSGASRLEVWLGSSGQARMERTYTTADGPATATSSVMIDDARSGGGGGLPAWPKPGDPSGRWPVPGPTDVERHFSHLLLRRIVAGLELQAPREGEVAGRPVVVAHAVRRGMDGPWPHWLPFGADGYELSFDRASGDLLAYEARLDGATCESATVTSVTYGEPDGSAGTEVGDGA